MIPVVGFAHALVPGQEQDLDSDSHVVPDHLVEGRLMAPHVILGDHVVEDRILVPQARVHIQGHQVAVLDVVAEHVDDQIAVSLGIGALDALAKHVVAEEVFEGASIAGRANAAVVELALAPWGWTTAHDFVPMSRIARGYFGAILVGEQSGSGLEREAPGALVLPRTPMNMPGAIRVVEEQGAGLEREALDFLAVDEEESGSSREEAFEVLVPSRTQRNMPGLNGGQ